MTVTVRFADRRWAPVPIAAGTGLAEVLDVHNSPVLFGCRTGLCATCLAEVEGDIPPPDAEEREMLAIHAPDNPRARLLCQVRTVADLTVLAVLG